jgi:hypothetical protein
MGWSATSFQFWEGTATLNRMSVGEQTAADYPYCKHLPVISILLQLTSAVFLLRLGLGIPRHQFSVYILLLLCLYSDLASAIRSI